MKNCFFKLFFVVMLLLNVSMVYAFEINGIKYNTTTSSACEVIANDATPYSGDVVIPETVTYNKKTYSVTAIAADAFAGCKELKSLTIPSTVVKIGASAFSDCTGLSSVNVASVDAWLAIEFVDMNSTPVSNNGVTVYVNGEIISEVAIPAGATELKNFVFYGWSQLTEVSIPEGVTSIGQLSLSYTSIEEFTAPSTLTTIGAQAFAVCTSLKTVTITPSVKTVGGGAFMQCKSLEKVNISDLEAWMNIDFPGSDANPLKIAKNLYLNGEELLSIDVPKNISVIKKNLFYNSKITSVTLHSGVTKIEEDAFGMCGNLAVINVPSIASWLAIDFGSASANPFNTADKSVALYVDGKKQENLEIPAGTTAIKQFAFVKSIYNKVEIPASLKQIGKNAFQNAQVGGVYISDLDAWCSITFTQDEKSNPMSLSGLLYLNGELLENVEITSSKISDYAFVKSKMRSVKVPNTVTSIGKDAFKKCDSLRVIEIDMATVPNSFAGLGAVAEVTLGGNVKTVAGGAFKGCNKLVELNMSASEITVENDAFYGCSNLATVNVPSFEAWLGYTFKNASANPVTFAGKISCEGEEEITELDLTGMTEIKPYAFSGFVGLTSVIIPETVETIGTSAFDKCDSIKAVKISDLSSWAKIAFANEAANPLSIAKKLYLNGELVEGAIEIPADVTEVGAYAFYNCDDITSVSVPATVTKIGASAFMGCDSVKSVGIADVNQWASIAFADKNANPLNVAKVLLLNGDTIKDVTIDAAAVSDFAFVNSSTLKSVVLTDAVNKIGNSAFENCEALESVVIPSSVTQLSDNSFKNTQIKSLSIDCATVKAWFKNSNVEGLVIGDNVTTIEENAFNNCLKLQSVSIGSKIKTIGIDAFKDCVSLTTLNINDVAAWCSVDISNGKQNGEKGNPMFYATELCINGEPATEVVIPNTVTEIKNYVFYGLPVETLVIPSSITKINDKSFFKCENLQNLTLDIALPVKSWFKDTKSLKNVVIGDGVEKIESSAFANCTGLKSLTIGNGLKINKTPTSVIAANAFNNCPNLSEITFNGEEIDVWCKGLTTLKSVTLSSKVAKIEKDAFAGCTYLKNVYIDDIMTWCNIEFGTYASSPLSNSADLYVNGKLLEELIIPDGVTVVKENIFRGCNSIKSVKFPEGVTEIADYAFLNASSIENIEFSTTIESIGAYAFYNCNKLPAVVLPAAVTSLSDYTFSKCSSLQSIEFSENIENIGYGAFAECAGLTKISIPNSITNIEGSAFEDCAALESVKLGTGISELSNSIFAGCSSLKNIEFAADITNIAGAAFAGCEALTEFTLPESLVALGDGAFMGCTGLTEIVIPAGVSKIADQTFADCENLRSVTIPASVDSICDWAFDNCDSLKAVKVSDVSAWAQTYFGYNANPLIVAGDLYENDELVTELSFNDDVTAISAYAFKGCKNITSVEIGENVETIGKEAFYGCEDLLTVKIPMSVKAIGYTAFYDCPNITSVYSEFGGVPAAMNTNYTFSSNVYDIATLFVPAGKKLNFESATGWLHFKNIAEDGTLTGIKDIVTAGEEGVYYNLLGIPVENPTKGVYILNGQAVMVE